MTTSSSHPDVDEVRTAMAGLRPRYAAMPDPHDRPVMPGGQPAVQLVDYMGDADSYFEINLIGPYPDGAARDADLARLEALPLGAAEFNGGYEFLPTTIDGEDDTDVDRLVEPATVAAADTVKGLYDAFWGCADEPADAALPGQADLFGDADA